MGREKDSLRWDFPNFLKAGRTLYGMIKGVIRYWGVLGTLRLLWTRRSSWFHTWATEIAFDSVQGVDTSPVLDTAGNIYPAAMQKVEGENWVYGVRYEPTRVHLFEQMIGASHIQPHCYSFIDYGSGKGRVLLLASRLPFRRVVGVEYSPELHRIAERNLRSSKFVDRCSGPVESICRDAVRYCIPEEPVVLYFFNPFQRQIMEIVRDNVVRSYEGNPRSIVVIYLRPLHCDLWDEVEFLKRYAWSIEVTRSSGPVPVPQYIIYKTSQG